MVAMLCAFSGSLRAAQFGDFTYETQFGEAIITGYTGVGGDVAFPDSINGQLVTEIDVAALAGNTGITQIELPTELLFIREGAFRNCTALLEVTIPGGVLEVGESAFEGCASLQTLTLESGVSLLLESAFRGCALERVVAPASIDFIDPNVFADNAVLDSIYFLGDAPLLDANALGSASTAYFFSDAVGFMSPEWEYASGYSIETFDLGELDRPKQWLLENYLSSAGLLEHPEQAPQGIALSYAFNVPPLSALSFEHGVTDSDDVFEIRYYADQVGVNYQPRVSSDLIGWTGDGVEISPKDEFGYRIASVVYEGETLFFDIQVTVSP